MKNTSLKERSLNLDTHLKDIKAPKPILSHRRETELSNRQRDLLDQLGVLFNKGFSNLTMADIAKTLNCSLRTLYSLAPSRDELVLIVIERNLWSVGRSAMSAIKPEMKPLEAIRTYLQAANIAVAGTTEAFAKDLEKVTSAQKLSEEHSAYLISVTKCLLDLSIEQGEIEPVDTVAIARLMAGIGRDFSRPEVVGSLSSSPKHSADEALDVVIAGLISSKKT